MGTERRRGRGTDRAMEGSGTYREREGSGGRIERRRGHRGDRDMWTQWDTREKTKVTNQNILC